MVWIPRKTRRIAAAVVLCALALPLFGTGSSVAAAAPRPSATVEAVCPAATPGTAQCLSLRRTDIAAVSAAAVSPLSPPSGYGPADLQSAYALPSGSAGSGLTVAVVDAYDLPTAEADLAAYRSQYGLPACTTANGCFRKVDQSGGTSYPIANANWGQEIALDIEMVSAACPNCHILLVEATTNSLTNLGTAVNTAVSLGAIAVSNSYGGADGSNDSSYDTLYYNHPGVAITASTGDCGYNCSGSTTTASVSYPAASPYVVAVGGTSLTRDTSTRGWTESAWGNAYGGAGSGCSLYESKPSWQSDSGCAKRTEADVSAVADPVTGVAVYVNGVWLEFGGTSASSPIIAATFALAGSPATGTYPASYLYQNSVSLNDVIGGNNDVTFHTCPVSSYLCNGVSGYDGPTGLGTPNGIGAFRASGSTYHPMTPIRLLDSRDGTGLSGAFVTNVARTFQVTGVGGIPANATAVTGNLTVTQQDALGYLYIGPVATDNPTSSTLNFPLADDRANGVTVALGAGGTLSVTYVDPWPGNTAQAIFDVTGYFTPDTTGSTYHPMTPIRLLDSRNGTGGLSGPFLTNVARTFQVRGVGGVSAAATAVTGNLTVTQQTAFGYLYVGPVAMNSPTSSTLNFPVNDDRANGVTVALGSTGTLSITYVDPWPGNSAQAIFDVTGYFTPDATGVTYHPLNPARILDSRNGTGGLSGPFSAWVARTFPVRGAGGVPNTATAATGNLTVTQQSASGYLFIGPVAMNSPTSSTLNFPISDDRANNVTVALGSTGTLSVTYVSATSGATTHAIFDVTGYFTP